jgi:large subunit ribosomal protein L25
VQFHPVTGALLHADFYVLEKGKKITISIPLEFEGTAPAEKAGHIITKVMHEIEIEVAPQELPQHLTVDLTTLVNVGDHVLVGDIKLPPSATLSTSADEIVASVTEFVEESAEIPTAPETEILTAKPAAEGDSEGEKKE